MSGWLCLALYAVQLEQKHCSVAGGKAVQAASEWWGLLVLSRMDASRWDQTAPVVSVEEIM